MKTKFKLTVGAAAVAVVLLVGSAVAQQGGTFSDPRNGQTYRTTRIGNLTWMAENLNLESSTGSWCYGNDPDNCNIYGRLYDWATAMNIIDSYNGELWGGSDFNHRGICPEGWRLPSDDDWRALVNFVGEPSGKKLKSKTGWNSNGNGTDEFGFSALPGGSRWENSNFNGVGNSGYWWSALEIGGFGAFYWKMQYDGETANSNMDGSKTDGFSVRCVRD